MTFGNFTELSLFGGLTYVGVSAFMDVKCGIIVFPKIITFESSSLTFNSAECVDLPSTITKIPNYTRGAKTWIIRTVVPPDINGYSNLFGASAIFVPDESVNAYKSASGWTSYSNIIKPLSEYH